MVKMKKREAKYEIVPVVGRVCVGRLGRSCKPVALQGTPKLVHAVYSDVPKGKPPIPDPRSSWIRRAELRPPSSAVTVKSDEGCAVPRRQLYGTRGARCSETSKGGVPRRASLSLSDVHGNLSVPPDRRP